MIQAFTGPTDLNPTQMRWAGLRMIELHNQFVDVWRSGCAYGIDTLAAWLALAMEVDLELYIPGAEHNEPMVRSLAPMAAKVKRVERGPSNSLSYRRRNHQMVYGADRLMAFVWKDKFYRSGEWMTINIAAKLGVPCDLYIIPSNHKEAE